MPADLDGALLGVLRTLDEEERFVAVVYVSDDEDHAIAHVEFRGRQPTSVHRAEYGDDRTLASS